MVNTLSYSELDTILKELATNKVWHLTVTGGEPLLEFEKLAYIKKSCDSLGISVSLNSNLTLMTAELAQELAHELNWETMILTSLPSLTSQECDNITQVSGSYQNILKGISICKEHGLRVGVNIVLTTNNIYQIRDQVENFVKTKQPLLII